MKPALKKKWVEALRSGDYKQGKGRLRRADESHLDMPDAFCCLGVLCQVSNPDGWTKTDVYRYSNQGGMFNAHFSREIGLPYDMVVDLVIMNDTGKGFGTIANWIEKNL